MRVSAERQSGGKQLSFIQDIKRLVAGGCEPVVFHSPPYPLLVSYKRACLSGPAF